MPVIAVGLTYRNAPLELLERLAIDPERRPKALATLLDREHVKEGVILSTCNRVEVYAVIDRFHEGGDAVRRFLTEFHDFHPGQLADYLQGYYEDRAVRHLFGVAAGIDSMVVGEAQILGQVREAFQAAQAERTVGPVLSALFAHALRVGRRARRETAIGEGLASTLSVSLEVAKRQFGSLAGRRALIVGAGKMARLAGRTLREAGVAELVIANRTVYHGATLATELGGRSVPIEAIEHELATVDLLVASTTAVTPTVTLMAVHRGLARRALDRALVVLDLGVPRDVEADVRQLPGVVLADLDALRALLETQGDGQGREVERVRALIAEETVAFINGQREARLAPTIRALRARADQVRQRELARVAPRLAELDPQQRQAVEALARGLVNKLLHDPIVRGKALAAGANGELYVSILRQLYALDEEDPES
ncbi:MAG TPA: glutamyl-tRNA reductase [Actinomycetes bacterium]|jgi:glutamyl-tRNA reductase|nr:glutamyl-tRNA reductase [Actinomycetes bacterium]